MMPCSAGLPRIGHRLAATLQRAQDARTRLAASLHGGARFKGLEKLLGYLHDVAHAFQEDPNCSRLAFLLTRCVADFETATEATLSGYLAVARDSMRDVMEIENLFLDFVVKPENIDTWLTGTRTTLKNYFKPVAVRERLHAAGVGRFTDSAYSADYAAHSEALHVTPHRYILDQKGFTTDGWAVDLGFSEIFEHFKRLQIAIARLTDVLSPGPPAWLRTKTCMTYKMPGNALSRRRSCSSSSSRPVMRFSRNKMLAERTTTQGRRRFPHPAPLPVHPRHPSDPPCSGADRPATQPWSHSWSQLVLSSEAGDRGATSADSKAAARQRWPGCHTPS